MNTTFPTKESDILGLVPEVSVNPKVKAAALALVKDRGFLALVRNRLIRKHNFSEEKAAEAEKAFLQYALLLLIEGDPLSPSELADEFWHAFILHTRHYTDWCQHHFGRFIHHEPETAEDQEHCHRTHHKTRGLQRKYFGSQVILASCNACSCSGHGCTVH